MTSQVRSFIFLLLLFLRNLARCLLSLLFSPSSNKGYWIGKSSLATDLTNGRADWGVEIFATAVYPCFSLCKSSQGERKPLMQGGSGCVRSHLFSKEKFSFTQ